MKKFYLLASALLLAVSMAASAVVRPWCYWTVGVMGDGVSTQQTLNLISDPFAIAPASVVAGSVFTFKVSAQVLPTSIDIQSSSDGQDVGVVLGSNGNVTFTWPIPVPLGQQATLFGRMTF